MLNKEAFLVELKLKKLYTKKSMSNPVLVISHV